MKKLLYLGLAALLLPALVACKGKGQSTEIVWQDGEVMAVAFLGYYDTFEGFEASPSYARLTRTFPQIVEATQVKCGLGREIYLVVPRDPMATLAVNSAGNYVTDENRQVYYRHETGKPVLLLNNWYQTNSQVVCTDSEGNTATYSPAIDKSTGILDKASDGTVHDISLPLPEPMKDYVYFNYSEGSDMDLGIRLRLQAGQPVLSLTASALKQIGFEEDAIVMADGDNEFNGINGVCKGVFLGTIGQDYNPVACVVMENGDVKMCSIFYAMQHGGPDLSDALPGFKDVTGLENGGGGPWVEEESGETYYEYETIYALDARGDRTEIPYFMDYGTYLARGDGKEYEVHLTPDWQYALTIWDNEEIDIFSNGYFYEPEAGDSVRKFQFHGTRHGYRPGQEAVEEYSTPVSGSFTTGERGLSYEVSLSGSDVFPSGLMFHNDSMAEND